MLIGVCGGICAGKRTISDYLIEHHGFTRLSLKNNLILQETHPDNIIISGTLNGTQVSTESQNSPNKLAEHIFETTEELLDFVTKRWRGRWVTTDIHNQNILNKLLGRPFFILLSVDAPISLRWKWWQARQECSSIKSPLTLEEFILKSDRHLYSSTSDSGQLLISRATVRLLNTSPSLAHLYGTLGKLDLTNEDRLRPSWDLYFMQLASLAAKRSNCMKRRVGCVLVREKRVISTGYNGTPRGLKNCGEGGCPRCNEGHGSGSSLGTCLCIHAEENALLEAGRDRIREGTVLYCDTCPCLTCSIKIAQVGISEVIYSREYSMDEDTAKIFKEAGVKLKKYIPPASGTIRLADFVHDAC